VPVVQGSHGTARKRHRHRSAGSRKLGRAPVGRAQGGLVMILTIPLSLMALAILALMSHAVAAARR
jgi:hypothetical protein